MAAAARRPERNPVEKRAAWLAKHYPRSVVADALAAWAEAVGLDHEADGFNVLARYDPVSETLINLDRYLRRRPDLRTTIYDAYLPWVANVLNVQHKDMLREVREVAERHPQRAFLQFCAKMSDYGELAAAAAGTTLPTQKVGGWDRWRTAITAMTANYKSWRRQVRESFGLIARWAAATRTDLGRVTFADALEAAHAWLETQGDTTSRAYGVVVYEWPDGWTIRELLTQADRAYEGKRMGHCLAAYEGADATSRFFSLRDPNNKPHVTVEWLREMDLPAELSGGFVSQHRGAGNSVPKALYTARVAEFRDQVLPTLVPTPVSVASDPLRPHARFFDGRYQIPSADEPVEVWNGHAYVRIDDINDEIEDQRTVLLDKGISHARIWRKLVTFHPEAVTGVEIPPSYEWWFVRRGPHKGLEENVDELVQAVRIADAEGQSTPIFAALGHPTGRLPVAAVG